MKTTDMYLASLGMVGPEVIYEREREEARYMELQAQSQRAMFNLGIPPISSLYSTSLGDMKPSSDYSELLLLL